MKFNRVGLCLTLFCLLVLPHGRAVAQTVSDSSAHAKTVKEHNPTKALVLSAILQGAGQVYNRQAWKIPIIYAAIGGVAYYTYTNYTQMKLYKDEYLYRVANNDAALNADLASKPTSNVYNLYEAYDKTFQLSVIISVAVYGINMLDAYVFGHLFDFQINDDLSLHVAPLLAPTLQPSATGLGTFTVAPVAAVSLRF